MRVGDVDLPSHDTKYYQVGARDRVSSNTASERKEETHAFSGGRGESGGWEGGEVRRGAGGANRHRSSGLVVVMRLVIRQTTLLIDAQV